MEGGGRKLLRRINPVLKIFIFFFSIFGSKLNLLFFSIIRNMPGYFGRIWRYIFIANCVKSIGVSVNIATGVYFKNPNGISLGSNITINEMCYLEGVGKITIGNDVAIAHNTTIISSNHTYQNPQLPMSLNPIIGDPIIIEDDVWIGCGVRILAGVLIKKRTIVAAGAVLNKSLTGNSILGGVPAKVIKRI